MTDRGVICYAEHAGQRTLGIRANWHKRYVTLGHYPAFQAFQNGPNWGQNVFIPMDWVIGGVERVGQGWVMLMSALAAGRSISLPALSTGGAKLAAKTTGAYARIREQFGILIGKFEGVQQRLAQIAATAYILDAARKSTALALDQGEVPVAITVEGANILTRNLIIFGQGAIRCHPYILDKMLAAENSDEQAVTLRFAEDSRG